MERMGGTANEAIFRAAKSAGRKSAPGWTASATSRVRRTHAWTGGEIRSKKNGIDGNVNDDEEDEEGEEDVLDEYEVDERGGEGGEDGKLRAFRSHTSAERSYYETVYCPPYTVSRLLMRGCAAYPERTGSRGLHPGGTVYKPVHLKWLHPLSTGEGRSMDSSTSIAGVASRGPDGAISYRYRSSEAQQKMRVASDAAAVYSLLRRKIVIDSHREDSTTTSTNMNNDGKNNADSSGSSGYRTAVRSKSTIPPRTRVRAHTSSIFNERAKSVVPSHTSRLTQQRTTGGTTTASVTSTTKTDEFRAPTPPAPAPPAATQGGGANNVHEGTAPSAVAAAPTPSSSSASSLPRVSRSAPAGTDAMVGCRNGDGTRNDKMNATASSGGTSGVRVKSGSVRGRSTITTHPLVSQGRLHPSRAPRLELPPDVCGRSLCSRSTESGTAQQNQSTRERGYKPPERPTVSIARQRGPDRDVSKLCLIPAGTMTEVDVRRRWKGVNKVDNARAQRLERLERLKRERLQDASRERSRWPCSVYCRHHSSNSSINVARP